MTTPHKPETFAGICTECGRRAEVCHAFAVTIGKAESFQPCPECLEKVRRGELRPQTRRLYAAGDLVMLQVLKVGQKPDELPKHIDSRATKLIGDLCGIVRADPHRGTEYETAFLEGTKDLTREIGWALYEMGGHPLMVFAHDVVRENYGPSARSLEVAWDGVGEWFD